MTTDLVRTVLEATGADVPAGLPGIDLRSPAAIAKGRTVTSAVFTHDIVDLDRPVASITHRWATRGRFKLIVPRSGQGLELFDVARDPYERTNLVDRHPDVVEDLRQAIDAWWPEAADLK